MSKEPKLVTDITGAQVLPHDFVAVSVSRNHSAILRVGFVRYITENGKLAVTCSENNWYNDGEELVRSTLQDNNVLWLPSDHPGISAMLHAAREEWMYECVNRPEQPK